MNHDFPSSSSSIFSSSKSNATEDGHSAKRRRTHLFADILLVAVAVCAVLAGCKKQQRLQTTRDFNGVKLDMAKLDSFTNAPPEVQGHVVMLRRAYRYSQFPQAIAELDQLANNSALTPEQKNLVTEFIEQTKRIIANSPPSGQ